MSLKNFYKMSLPELISEAKNKMSLKIFYDALTDDEGIIIGTQLVLEHEGKYLSIEDWGNNKFYFYDEETGEQAVVDMTKQENLNKINDLIKKVLE
jgi:hypothetical protein